MPDIEFIRAEIERMRIQVCRQRGEIRQLQRAGISTTSTEALLDRMLNNIDGLCAERDRLKKEQPRPSKGKCWAGVGGEYARASKLVRRQGRQSAVGQNSGRGSAFSSSRRLALPTRPKQSSWPLINTPKRRWAIEKPYGIGVAGKITFPDDRPARAGQAEDGALGSNS
jgi:hypothetical protein